MDYYIYYLFFTHLIIIFFLFLGVSCELGLHDDVNENLKKLGDSPTYELAYDGLSLKFP